MKQYVGIGSTVVFKKQPTTVVGERQLDGRSCVVLEMESGQRVTVPVLDVMYRGGFWVIPDGVKVADSITAAEKVLQEIRNHMKVWDQENPNPPGLWREAALDGLFMDWLRGGEANAYDNERLGLIVRQVMTGIEEL